MRRIQRKSGCFSFLVMFLGVTLGGIGGCCIGLAILRQTNPENAAKFEAELSKSLVPWRDYLADLI